MDLAESLSFAKTKNAPTYFEGKKKRQRKRITDEHELNRNKETSEAKSSIAATLKVFSLSHIISPIKVSARSRALSQDGVFFLFFLLYFRWILSFVNFFSHLLLLIGHTLLNMSAKLIWSKTY